MTSDQCRAGRAIVAISQGKLSELTGVSKRTIAGFEKAQTKPYGRTLNAIQTALEAAGVDFLAENGGGAGVRLKDRKNHEKES